MREIDVVFDPERKLFLYFAVALMAISVGPFGTYEAMTLWERAIFWSLDVLGGMAIIVPVLHVFYHSRLVAFIPSWPRFLIGVALGAVPTAAFITVLYGTIGRELQITTPYPLLFVQVTVFSSVLLIVEFVIWPAVFGSSVAAPVEEPAIDRPAMNNRPQAAPATVVSEPAPAEAPFPADVAAAAVPEAALLARLPTKLRRSEILSISMQDHYAEVTTSKGSALILMRLGDAIALLDGVPGAQVHRSHWVADAAVRGIARNGRRWEILLADGRRLPVGNTYLKAVQQRFGDIPGAAAGA